jgi:hypothetical protein
MSINRLKSCFSHPYLFLELLLLVLITTAPSRGQPASSDPAAQLGASANSAAETSSSRPVLQGNIEHSESLPSLDESLQPGAKFDEDVLIKLATAANNEWFWIPSWYAGKRHTDEALIVYRYNYDTGATTTPMQRQLERQDSVSGYQRDRNGEIWDFKNIPHIQHIDSGAVLAVLYVKNMTPLFVDRSKIVLKYEEVSITYSPKNHKILEVTQQEQINTIRPMQTDALRADISVKSFAWDGKPQRAEQSIVFSNIIEPFHPIDTLDEKDLRSMFRDYLIAHKYADLVPENLAN